MKENTAFAIPREFLRSSAFYQGHEMKVDEMGMACNTHGTDEKCVQNFSGKS